MAAPVNEGDVLAGKYQVERVLGVGGMGVVVQAMHLHLGQRVALKFLLPEGLHAPEARARFDREARAAARLRGEHVARVLDVGHLDNGAPYIVMEFLDGCDLGELVKKMGPLPLEEAVEALVDACEAMAEAHAAEIVHRDLKPANLFRTQRADGSPLLKVLDFGISKSTALSGSDPSLTSTSGMMGSPLYMSPEQLESAKNVDHRTDIWALGAIFYELLTGAAPFQRESLAQLCVAILQEPHRPLSSVRPGLPRELDVIIDSCLSKDRRRRFQTVAELAEALRPFAPAHCQPTVDRVSRVISGSSLAPPHRISTAPAHTAPQPVVSAISAAGAPDQPGSLGPTSKSWARTKTHGTGPTHSPKPNVGRWLVPVALVLVAAGGVLLYLLLDGTSASVAGLPPPVVPSPSTSPVSHASSKPAKPSSEPNIELVPTPAASPTTSSPELAAATPRQQRPPQQRPRQQRPPQPKQEAKPTPTELVRQPQPTPARKTPAQSPRSFDDLL